MYNKIQIVETNEYQKRITKEEEYPARPHERWYPEQKQRNDYNKKGAYKMKDNFSQIIPHNLD